MKASTTTGNNNNRLRTEKSRVNAILLNTDEKDIMDDILNHHFSNKETPLRADAFDVSNDEKISIIAGHVKEILHTLGLDLNDESIRDTPLRVAKMYINETFRGLNPENKPTATLFTNNYNYSQMLVEKNITFYSTCEHHLVPIFGKVHVAYYSSGKVIGLSKLNRMVDYYARRPQVQERLTIQIAEALKEVLQTEDVAIVIDSTHLCVASRGIQDVHSTTITAEYCGKFKNRDVRNEFLQYTK
ncbi:MAG: GTP cyclohydrolase I FolE [Bacteroidetes bacterium]|jgi:GTP cyclohydrolase I|nr:GTP cyclohydrolase I FolE [Bacteroidota bacterium]